MKPFVSPWDESAAIYGEFIARREQADPNKDPILSRMLPLLGELAGRGVLDAGCGEGFLARVLAARGARVTGLDLSPRLIQMARQKDPPGTIAYRVADLSRSLPELAGRFELVCSHLALDDVADHRGFATTLAALARAGGRMVLVFNNPYSSVVREHISDYFDNGAFVHTSRSAFQIHYRAGAASPSSAPPTRRADYVPGVTGGRSGCPP